MKTLKEGTLHCPLKLFSPKCKGKGMLKKIRLWFKKWKMQMLGTKCAYIREEVSIRRRKLFSDREVLSSISSSFFLSKFALVKITRRFRPRFRVSEVDLPIVKLLISVDFTLPSPYPLLYHSVKLNVAVTFKIIQRFLPTHTRKLYNKLLRKIHIRVY